MFFDSVSGKELARGMTARCIPSETEAQACQELANRFAAIWKSRLADLEKTLSIRYEKLPPNGRSRNYVTGKLEVGVSVYPALLLGRLFSMTIMASGTLIGVMPRTPYLVEGEYVPNGNDGES
jgi:hypothetical protein